MIPRQFRLLAAVALVTATMAGCTQSGPYRTTVLTTSPAGVSYALVECFAGRAEPTGPRCDEAGPGSYALQHRQYRYQNRKSDGSIERRLGDYHMAFVEFDDQGWFADRRQMEALFMLLRKLEENDRHVLLLLYAHGWKHNASRCDDNVQCFSRLVERMDILERHLPDISGDTQRRHVVAVYVGWRGLSLRGGPLANVTFWTRKATAERVGHGGVKELLTRLDDYRRIRNPQRDDAKTQLAIAGHSFGGALMYSAISHVLVERAARVRRIAGTDCDARGGSGTPSLTCYDTAISFGDLIVLVNPAFQGSLYEPLFDVAVNRCYRATQRPVMMTVTSSGDTATGFWFPFGRRTNTLFERFATKSPAQRGSIIKAVGHDPRYRTHWLEWRGKDTAAATPPSGQPAEPSPEERSCGCPYLETTDTFRWWEFTESVPELRETVQSKTVDDRMAPVVGEPSGEDRVYRVYGPHVQLRGDGRYAANMPYLMVQADPKIIADHNAIYNEPFVRFVHSFFLLHVANRRPFEAVGCMRDFPCQAGGPLPCERSCRVPNGLACSDPNAEVPPRK